jgi:alpha-glucosidase
MKSAFLGLRPKEADVKSAHDSTAKREFIRLRYRLLPYLYTALWQCTQTGAPIVRPLLWAFQDDPTTHTLDDEFLCGDALVVAPMLEEGATRRRVYLPAGLWYDFWTDERHEGPGWLEVEAPLERIPVFVRAEAVVPTGPEMDYVGQRPTDPLTLHLYLPAEGQEGVSFLYEDDGETLAYRQVRATARSSSSPPAGTADTGPAESSVWPERSCCYPPGK